MTRFSWPRSLLLTLLLTTAPRAAAAPLPELRPGDVILIALRCYVCGVISHTTGSPYSHSGLALSTAGGSGVEVAQALGPVAVVPLSQFLTQRVAGSTVMVRRPRELAERWAQGPAAFAVSAAALSDAFATKMAGRNFDDAYRWDNVDDHGEELLYCSEMVQKTLNMVLSTPLPTQPLNYRRDWDFWQHYFHGRVPQGEPGNSPSSLATASELLTVFEGTLD